MILVHRPVHEPVELAAERAKRLPVARSQHDAATLESKHLTGYIVARPALYDAQHGKCAYCEWRPLAIDWSPVEHYRPKGVYWWLT